jgi:hypothetical protein
MGTVYQESPPFEAQEAERQAVCCDRREWRTIERLFQGLLTEGFRP